jgi:hypothetical protein
MQTKALSGDPPVLVNEREKRRRIRGQKALMYAL